MVLLWGCGGGGGSEQAGDGSSDRSAAIRFQLEFEPSSKQVTSARSRRAIAEPNICDDYLIEEIVVEVYRTLDNAEVASVQQSCSAHSLTIGDIPAGVNLYVVCKGYIGQQIHWQSQVDNITVNAGQTSNIGIMVMRYIGTDESPPEVTSTSPEQDTFNVELDTPISVVFNERIAPSSISDQAITVLNADTPVPGQVSYDPATYTIRFTPTSGDSLSIETTYTVTLIARDDNDGPITDTAGHAFIGDISWQFTTRGTNLTGPQNWDAMIWDQSNWE